MSLPKPAAIPVGIVGAGTMGRQIAALNVRRGIPVRLVDTQPLDRSTLARFIACEADTTVGAVMPFLSTCTSIDELSGCRVIIECITEVRGLKLKLFRQLRAALGPQVLLASNSSSFPASSLLPEGEERLVIMHFFHPVRRRRLVELAAADGTPRETKALARAYCTELGQIPLAAPDIPGFIVNRLLQFYCSTGLSLARSGIAVPAIDAAARRFGMDLGPIEYLDQMGLDVALRSGSHVSAAMPNRVPPSPELIEMVRGGCLGQKSGVGFYDYSDGERLGVSQPACRLGFRDGSSEIDEEFGVTLTGQLIGAMFSEARCLLEQGVASEDIDLASCHGFGFPEIHHGLVSWAREAGVADLGASPYAVVH